jgi:hypothetical protein
MGKYTNHRWVWIKHNGEIPIDENGQTYEIHHIDRDKNNNSIENLLCVSKREHAQLHFDVGEYAAAYSILKRTKGVIKDFTGWKHTEETKQKISMSISGDKNPMFGRTREDRKGKGYWNGKIQPKEMVEARVQKMIGQKRPKQSEAMMGRNVGDKNPMFGKKGKEHHRSKPVKDLETGKEYDSVVALCIDKNYKKASFYYNLKKGNVVYINGHSSQNDKL